MDDRWPINISSNYLYEKTQQLPCSSEITKRRLRLYGPLMGLPEETPIRISMKEHERPLKMERGARRFTWMKNIDNDLERIGVDRGEVCDIAQDRKRWRSLIRSLEAD